MLALVVTAFVAWLALSVVNQLRPGRHQWCRTILGTIKSHDVLYLIPDYAFFAPNPMKFDYEVLYRDRLEDGTLTAWRALALHPDSWWRAIWNPTKRRHRMVWELGLKLGREVRMQIQGRRHPSELFVSEPYVAIAQCVAAAPHSITGRETQFVLALSTGFEARKEAAISFISPFFRL